MDNKALIKQYINTGALLTGHQISKLNKNNKQSYVRRRMLQIQEAGFNNERLGLQPNEAEGFGEKEMYQLGRGLNVFDLSYFNGGYLGSEELKRKHKISDEQLDILLQGVFEGTDDTMGLTSKIPVDLANLMLKKANEHYKKTGKLKLTIYNEKKGRLDQSLYFEYCAAAFQVKRSTPFFVTNDGTFDSQMKVDFLKYLHQNKVLPNKGDSSSYFGDSFSIDPINDSESAQIEAIKYSAWVVNETGIRCNSWGQLSDRSKNFAINYTIKHSTPMFAPRAMMKSADEEQKEKLNYIGISSGMEQVSYTQMKELPEEVLVSNAINRVKHDKSLITTQEVFEKLPKDIQKKYIDARYSEPIGKHTYYPDWHYPYLNKRQKNKHIRNEIRQGYALSSEMFKDAPPSLKRKDIDTHIEKGYSLFGDHLELATEDQLKRYVKKTIEAGDALMSYELRDLPPAIQNYYEELKNKQ